MKKKVHPDNCPPGSLPLDMGDLDLLIQKQDWKKAVQGLNDSGYCPLISSENDSFAPPDIGQMDFVRSEPDGRIDLHYNMNKNQRVEGLFIIEEMWQRGKTVEFEGISALVPSISDQFWIRLVHFFILHLIIKAYYLKFLRMKKETVSLKQTEMLRILK